MSVNKQIIAGAVVLLWLGISLRTAAATAETRGRRIAFVADREYDRSLGSIYAGRGLTCFSDASLEVLKSMAYGNYLEACGMQELSSRTSGELLDEYLIIIVPWVPDWDSAPASELKEKLIGYADLGGVLYLEGPVGADPGWLDFFDIVHEGSMAKLAGYNGKAWSIIAETNSRFPIKSDWIFSYSMAWWSDDTAAVREKNPLTILCDPPPNRRPPHVPFNDGYPRYVGTVEPRNLCLFQAYRGDGEGAQELFVSGRWEGKEKEVQLGESLFIRKSDGNGIAVYMVLPFLDLAGQMAYSTAGQGRGLFCRTLAGGCEFYNALQCYLFNQAGLNVPQRSYLPNSVEWTWLPLFDITSFPDTGAGEMYDERISEVSRLLYEHNVQGVFIQGWDGDAKPITSRQWPLLNGYGHLCGLYYSASRYGFDSEFVRNTIDKLKNASGQFPHMVRDSGKRYQGKRGSFWGRDMLETLEKAYPGEYFFWCDEAYNAYSSTFPIPYLSERGDDPYTYLISAISGSKDRNIRNPSLMPELLGIIDKCREERILATPHVHIAFNTLEHIRSSFHTMVDRLVSTPGYKPVNPNDFFFYNIKSSKYISTSILGAGDREVIINVTNKHREEPVFGYTLYLPGVSVKRVESGARCLLTGNNGYISIPHLKPSETKKVKITLGNPDSTLPSLDFIGGDLEISRAEYDYTSQEILIDFSGKGHVFLTAWRFPFKECEILLNGEELYNVSTGFEKRLDWFSYSDFRGRVLSFEFPDLHGRAVSIRIKSSEL